MLLIIFATSAYGNVHEKGDIISSVDYNNDFFNIGDIKNSSLSVPEFSTVHGNCWIQLNQNLTDIDITGTDLASALNTTTIKSSSDRVLRSKGSGFSESLGEIQEDEFLRHRHSGSVVVPKKDGDAGDGDAGGLGSNSSGNEYLGDRDYNLTIASKGGNETRFKNLTVNTFIKVNKECN